MVAKSHGTDMSADLSDSASLHNEISSVSSFDMLCSEHMKASGSVFDEKILESLFLLSTETLAGRVRFSTEQRNVGRDPVLMQQQVGYF